jgi:hypothetical protein
MENLARDMTSCGINGALQKIDESKARIPPGGGKIKGFSGKWQAFGSGATVTPRIGGTDRGETVS